MDFKAFKQEAAKAAESLGIKEYELYYTSSEDTDISTFRHEINEFSSSVSGGVCFRCIVDGRMGYASTEELSEAEAQSVVRRAKENASVIENDDRQFLTEGGQKYREPESRKYKLPETEELIKKALEGDKKLYEADKQIIDGSAAGTGVTTVRTAIVNSKGLDLSYEASAAYFMADAVVSDGKEMSDAYKMVFGSYDELDIGAAVGEAVEKAKAMLGYDVAPTGSYPVVFAPEAMTSLLSAFSGIFNSENVQKGLSRLKGREGEKIAADCVSLIDDPFYPGNGVNIGFDAEGSPTETKNVIENGVLKTLLYNLKTANIAGVKTTGNAAKAGYAAPVEIRPFTFYLAAGSVSEEELFKNVGEGVYVTSLGGLHAGANAVSGDFSLQSAGFMIEGGVKTKAVKSFTVSGNLYELLKNITALSDTVKLPRPFGITAFGSPAVAVRGLTVAGK